MDGHKLRPQASLNSHIFHLKCDVQQKGSGSTFRLAVEFFSVDATCNKEPDWVLIGLAVLSPWARDLQTTRPSWCDTVSIEAPWNYSCDFLFVSVGRVVFLLIVSYPSAPVGRTESYGVATSLVGSVSANSLHEGIWRLHLLHFAVELSFRVVP
jgi:hypothetical protein